MGLFCYLRLQIAALIPCDELPGGRLIRSVQGDANLPSRTATAGDTGLRSMLAGDAEKSCNLGFCPAGGWNYILPQQGAGMGRATIRMPSGGVNHNNFLS
jgi:hypothetical protein